MKWQEQLANSTVLGMMSFGIATTFVGCVNAGFANDKDVAPLLWALVICVGGGAQILAGILEMVRGNTLNVVMFVSYGVYWFTTALAETVPFVTNYTVSSPSQTATTLFNMLYCLLTLALVSGSFFRDVLMQVLLVSLFFAFLLLTIGNAVAVWTSARIFVTDSGTLVNERNNAVVRVSGYFAIVSGTTAMVYAGLLLNGWPHPRSPLPLLLRRWAERI